MERAHFFTRRGNLGLDLLRRQVWRHATPNLGDERVKATAPVITAVETPRQKLIDCSADQLRNTSSLLRGQMLERTHLAIVEIDVRSPHVRPPRQSGELYLMVYTAIHQIVLAMPTAGLLGVVTWWLDQGTTYPAELLAATYERLTTPTLAAGLELAGLHPEVRA
jgi:hypothetical protein